MRAVVDSGCTRTLVPHPQFCVDGSIVKLAEPVQIKGLGGIVKSNFTGTLRIKSNVPGCNRTITMRNVLITSSTPRTLVCVSELDDMGYKSEFYDKTLFISEKQADTSKVGPRTCIFPRFPEVDGKLLDDEVDESKTKHRKGAMHALYPIPDDCFETSAVPTPKDRVKSLD
jgi:hypothetical protein